MKKVNLLIAGAASLVIPELFQMNPVFFTSAIYLLAFLLCLLALLRPNQHEPRITKLESAFGQFSARPFFATAALFLGVLLLRVALLPIFPVPTPGAHDEFSFLLLGDTITHGRLANPTPPLYQSFETFHENMYPTYCSKYAPAQGFFLAFGQILGNPWIGVLVSASLLAALFFWGLRIWMPSRWAFLAALLAALKLCVASYWINSYWGGAVAASAGALALGGLGRILKRPDASGALTFAAGISILANSRPYEGLIFSLPLGAVFLWWMLGKTDSAPPWPVRLRKVILPAAAVLVAGVGFVGYYNWRTTGSPRIFAMSLNQKFYDSSAIFIWETPGPPMPHNNPQFDDFYNRWQRNLYHHTSSDLQKIGWRKIRLVAQTYFWWDLLLILPALYFLHKRRKLYILWAALLFNIIAFFSLAWTLPHYVAPAMCAFFALFAAGIRQLRLFEWRGYALGLFLSRLVILGLVLQTANAVVTGNEDPMGIGGVRLESRMEVIHCLEATPGKHLVLVRYSPHHYVHDEWVFNGADIEASRIVWARELDAAQNQKLIEHFQDRKIWVVEADKYLARPVPYAPLKN